MPEITGFDHLYLSVSNLARAEAFYDRAMAVLGFHKNRFELGVEAHVQYYNRHFGLVLRPARFANAHEPYAPGLHHVCLRVDSIDDVMSASRELRAAGIPASDAALHTAYAPDYWATHFHDPDGIHFEITNYRAERRARHDNWPLA
ncbi:VOC family protein [Niveibacterium sp. 24ML]|uniref:VOC family protein n=1 Tax=Niveibacterium sp. 24ML TaxID=2985512 RepID=UPI00226DEC98|nr:VOC family protein [Niveibacterium sp. 24ML]MCX9154958.1 VOC family protein [Niveibacterium sp. 24ML]